MIEAIRIGNCQKWFKQLSLQEASGSRRGEREFSDYKEWQNQAQKKAGLLSYTHRSLLELSIIVENITPNIVISGYWVFKNVANVTKELKFQF